MHVNKIMKTLELTGVLPCSAENRARRWVSTSYSIDARRRLHDHAHYNDGNDDVARRANDP